MAFWKKDKGNQSPTSISTEPNDKTNTKGSVDVDDLDHQIESAIKTYIDPYLQMDLVKAGAVKDIQSAGGSVSVSILLGYPGAGVQHDISTALKDAIESIPDIKQASVNVSWKISTHEAQPNANGIANVKNIIAVASGKGGVGKSTTTVNLALALSAEGASVGILDADIYGPSLPIMLGLPPNTKPDIRDNQYFIPIEAHGIQAMSMGFMVDENTPMVWRGPMASGALQQMLNQTLWRDLDYLLIDMPPGTGDIQLTLSQAVPVTGSLIVTTPQDIALLDAIKGIEMFRKVDIPVLGIIENMSTHICSECGHEEHIFGHGGGEKIAMQYSTDLLGSLPLNMKIRQQADGGKPTVVAEPKHPATVQYKEIARRFTASLSMRQSSAKIPNIMMVDD